MVDNGGNVAEVPSCGAVSPQSSEAFPDSLEIDVKCKGASEDADAKPSKFTISRFEWSVTTAAFFCLGLSSLFAWNNILYVLPYITEHFLDNWDAGNSLLGVYQVGNLCVQPFLLYVGALYKRWLYVGLILGSILCGGFGPSVIYGSFAVRIAMLHVLCLLLGAGSGFIQGSGMSFAGLMPVNQVAVFTSGQGFASIFSVLLIGILAYTALDIDMRDDVATLIHICSALTVASGIACMILFRVTMEQPAAKQVLVDVLAVSGTDKASVNSGGPTGVHEVTAVARGAAETRMASKKPLVMVLKLVGVPIACILVLFFVTCNLFPRVGPLQWKTSHPPKNHFVWLLGIFPFGDTFGRLLCAFGDKWMWLKKAILFPPRLLPWLSLSRVALYIPFFLSKHLKGSVVFNAFWFQMIEMLILSASHGWFCTVAFMYSFAAVPDAYKRHVGPVSVVSLIFGILAGLYFALVFK